MGIPIGETGRSQTSIPIPYNDACGHKLQYTDTNMDKK